MATHRSFTEEFQDLYNQVQEGYHLDNPNPNLDHGPLADPRAGYDDSSNYNRLARPFLITADSLGLLRIASTAVTQSV